MLHKQRMLPVQGSSTQRKQFQRTRYDRADANGTWDVMYVPQVMGHRTGAR